MRFLLPTSRFRNWLMSEIRATLPTSFFVIEEQDTLEHHRFFAGASSKDEFGERVKVVYSFFRSRLLVSDFLVKSEF